MAVSISLAITKATRFLMSNGVVHEYDFIRERMADLGLDPYARAIAEKNAPKVPTPTSTEPDTGIGACFYCQEHKTICDGACWC